MSDAAATGDGAGELPRWLQLPDLASARLGGTVPWANDEFFAGKENLLRPERPIFREHEYTDRGKWMDGWETRRRRTPGHDSCIVKLGLPGVVRGVVVDTAFFRGNYPSHCSLEACAADGEPSVEELQSAGTEPERIEWVEILPKVALAGDSANRFAVESPWRFTHLRLHIYPDGGVARLRVHGEVMPDWPRLLAGGGEIDLVAVGHGGRWLLASDMFFSAPGNLLMPGRGVRMDDGWETKRRRGPGHDWVVLALGIAGTPRCAEVDTAHFKGNYPDTCALETCAAQEIATGAAPPRDDRAAPTATSPTNGPPVLASAAKQSPDPADPTTWPWREVLPRTKLQADAVNTFALADGGEATHVRFAIHPDGGVSRLRLFGEPSAAGRRAAAVAWLDALVPGQAQAALLACCGSPAWAQRMTARRPFGSAHALLTAADTVWGELTPEDWLEAFRAHPEIGGTKAEAGQPAPAAGWSAQEQSGVRDAAAATRAALAEANRAYRERFGHIFIVCATGKSAEEMLALCRQRLANDPQAELRVAGEEQRQITRLRLAKLLSDGR